MDIIDQIADYFNLLKFKFTKSAEGDAFHLVFTERKDEQPASPTAPDDEKTFRYTINVTISDKWVQVYCDVYPLDKIPDEQRAGVFLDLLAMNRKYAEVCFDYDAERGIIGTSQEMLVRGLNFDLFRDEFLAVPWAVKRFWVEIASKHGLQ